MPTEEEILNNQTNVENQPETMSGADYIAKVNELKKNSVPKAEYEKILKENKELADAVLNNTIQEKEDDNSQDVEAELQDLRKSLFNSENVSKLSNREYWEKNLRLRDILISRGERDPFLPTRNETQEDVEKAERFAKTLKNMLNESAGRDSVFNGLFEESLVEIKLPPRRR